jgi:hypothetical protein
MAIDPGLAKEVASYVELIKVIGFPALIFLIWYLYHRSENLKWEKNFEAQREMQREMIQGILKQSSEERENQLLRWKEFLETLSLQTSQLARLETKIDSNEFCPITRRQKR